MPRYTEGIRAMAGWMAAGTVKAREDVVSGIAKFPDALLELFTGENHGKLVLATR